MSKALLASADAAMAIPYISNYLNKKYVKALASAAYRPAEYVNLRELLT